MCEFNCCPFQDGSHRSSYETMMSFITDQVSKIPVLRWHRLMAFCKSSDIYRCICQECRARKHVRDLVLQVFDTHPPLFILKCNCYERRGMVVRCYESFKYHPWSRIIPRMGGLLQKIKDEWENSRNSQ